MDNIKKYAYNYIKDIENVNSVENIIKKIKSLQLDYARKLYENKENAEIINQTWENIEKGQEEGIYLELCFIDVFNILNNKYSLQYTIKKIKEMKKKSTPDFLIKNSLGKPIALFECTSLNLQCDKDIKRLNEHLKEVLNTPNHPLALAPEFCIPDQYLTLLLGFNEIKRKIKDKVKQFDKFKMYLINNPKNEILTSNEFDESNKFIIIDLSWFIFDARIMRNYILGNKINKLDEMNETYKLLNTETLSDARTKEKETITKVFNVINKLSKELKTHNIGVILMIAPICPTSYPPETLIIIDQYKIYSIKLEDFVYPERHCKNFDFLKFQN